MAEQIKVTIPPLGKPVIEAFGFSGTSCRDATEALEKALAHGDGKVVVEKPEINEVSHDSHEVEHQHY